VYRNLDATPKLDRALGELGGVFSGEVSGRWGDSRFIAQLALRHRRGARQTRSPPSRELPSDRHPHGDVPMDALQGIVHSINAFRRHDGEYLVFIEDNGYIKNLLYRWRP
jgi:hypothetical protein